MFFFEMTICYNSIEMFDSIQVVNTEGGREIYMLRVFHLICSPFFINNNLKNLFKKLYF